MRRADFNQDTAGTTETRSPGPQRIRVLTGHGGLMGGRFVLEEADAALDGGSIFLTLRDRSERRHRIELVQSMFLTPKDPARLPGRLYVDGKLIAVRSEQERMLLDGLREAMGASAEVPGGSEFVRELLRFVESDRYAGLAKGTGQQK